jgi:hypothetical protein
MKVCCEYCWRPVSIVVDAEFVDGVPHNSGCPMITGEFEDWKRGSEWGYLNSTTQSNPGHSKAYYFGVRAGKAEMEAQVNTAADSQYHYYGYER